MSIYDVVVVIAGRLAMNEIVQSVNVSKYKLEVNMLTLEVTIDSHKEDYQINLYDILSAIENDRVERYIMNYIDNVITGGI